MSKDNFNEDQHKEYQVTDMHRENIWDYEPIERPRKNAIRWVALSLALFMILFGMFFAAGRYLGLPFEDTHIEKQTLDSIPDLRIDLSQIFESDAEWENGIKRLETLTGDLVNMKDTLGTSEEAFLKALRLYDNVYVLLDQINLYASLRQATDVDNENAADMVQKASYEMTKVSQDLSFMNETVTTQISKSKLEAYGSHLKFEPYVDQLEFWIQYHDYDFSKIDAEFLSSGMRLAQMPEEIFKSFYYYTDIVQDSPNYEDATSRVEDRRIHAYKTLYEKDRVGQEILASALESEVLSNNYMAKLYGYDNAFEMNLSEDGISEEAFEEMLKTLKAGLDDLHRWTAIQKTMRGIESNEKYHIYDANLPIVFKVMQYEKDISYEEGMKLLKNVIVAYGEEYTKTFREIFEQNRIDLKPREDKFTGAYTWTGYKNGSFMVVNNYGHFEDLMTLAHESAHAVHQDLSRRYQSYQNHGVSVLTAEMAATTNEILLLEYILDSEEVQSQEERAFYLQAYANAIEDTVYYQLMAHEFQKRIHEDSANGMNLDATYLNGVWSELLQEYKGPDYEVTELDGLGWTGMQHLYWDFYVYKYAIGMTAGVSNADRLLHEEGFSDKYMELLKEGSAKTPGEQLEALGYGQAGEQSVKYMQQRFHAVLDELETLIDAQE